MVNSAFTCAVKTVRRTIWLYMTEWRCPGRWLVDSVVDVALILFLPAHHFSWFSTRDPKASTILASHCRLSTDGKVSKQHVNRFLSIYWEVVI